MRWFELLFAAVLALSLPRAAEAGITTTVAQQGTIFVNAATGDVGVLILVSTPDKSAIAVGTPQPTGLVQVLNGTTVLAGNDILNLLVYGCPVADCTNVLGGVNFTLPNLAPGSYTLNAVYAGDAYYDPSTSAGIQFVVPDRSGKIATSLAQQNSITVNATTGDVGVLLVASTPDKSSLPSRTPQPSGLIQVFNGSTVLGSNAILDLLIYGCPVSDCTNVIGGVFLTLPNLPPGSYTLTASYAGDAYYGGSISPTFSFVVPERPAQIATSVAAQESSITVNASTGDVGVLLVVSTPDKASVPSGTPQPSGQIQVLNGSTVLGSIAILDLLIYGCPVADCSNVIGGVYLTLPNLPPGSYTLSATYAGDTYYGASVSPAFSFVVPARPAKIVTTIAAPENAITINAATGDVGILAIASTTNKAALPGGTPEPTGLIQILSGSTVLGSNAILNLLIYGCPVSDCTNVLGGVFLTLPNLAPGNYTVQLVYAGDTYYEGSSSAAFSFVVPARPSRIATSIAVQEDSISINAATGDVGVLLLASTPDKSALPPGTPQPTGLLQVVSGGTVVGSNSIVNLLIYGCPVADCSNVIGGVFLTLPNLAPGSYTLNAVYGGDTYYGASTSATFTVVVPDRIAANPPIISFGGPTATHSGNVTVSLSGGGASCGFTADEFVPLTGSPDSPPAAPPSGSDFVHGLIKFQASGCTPGSTVIFTLTFPPSTTAIQAYWKFGKSADNATPHWYQMPAIINGNQVQLSITDGALGDDDLTANGTISDPGGPVFSAVPSTAQPAPALSRLATLLLALMLGLMARFGNRNAHARERKASP